jgi:hypothetical protein
MPARTDDAGMDFRIPRHRLVAAILAVALAAETVGAVAASVPGATARDTPADQPPVGQVIPAPEPTSATPQPVVHAPAVRPGQSESASPALAAAPSATPAPEPTAKPKKAEPKAAPKPKQAPKAITKPKSTAKAKSTRTHKLTVADFKGSNHVWIPALGISRTVRAFPCDRNRPPDSYMYRWGCAGENNVYLLGHAYSVMEPLHDAYYNGRLKMGMKAYYAAPNGKVRVYAVRWWKTTLPTPDASWAWASQPVPSMTLQTCVGKNSKYRLMVRLVEVQE